MRLSTCAALVGALTAPSANALSAAEAMNGRWAADPSYCNGSSPARSPLVVSNEQLRWSGEVCRIGRSYRTGATLHLEAFCSGKAGGKGIAVSLRLSGDRIILIWNHAARGELRRCPLGSTQ